MRRRHRSLAPLLLACLLTIGPASVAARETPTTGDRYTPIDASTLIAQATVTPDPLFAAGTFRIGRNPIRTLTWEQLPHNGSSLMRLLPLTNVPADEQGIPYSVVNGRNYYHPGNIAEQGIRYVDSYVRTGNIVYRKRAETWAAKLREIGFVRNGGLFIPYQFDYPQERLSAPWVSAYSQGFALSLFVRLYRVTGNRAHLDTAQSIFRSFRQLGPSSSRPWVSHVASGDLWFQQYPSTRPSYVLNGFAFATFGVYDYERLTRDPAATQLLQGAISTLRRNAGRYRVPGEISLYDLVHRTQLRHYHDVVVWQMRDLNIVSRDPFFYAFSKTIEADGS